MEIDEMQLSRLVTATERLAEETRAMRLQVEEARRDIDSVARCVTDLATEINTNVKIQDREAVLVRGDLNDIGRIVQSVETTVRDMEKALAVKEQLDDLPEDIAELFDKMSAERLAELVPRPVLDGARRIAYGGEPTGPVPRVDLTPVPPSHQQHNGLVWHLWGLSIPVGSAGGFILKKVLPLGGISTAVHYLWELLQHHVR
jgi:hypothetical protein